MRKINFNTSLLENANVEDANNAENDPLLLKMSYLLEEKFEEEKNKSDEENAKIENEKIKIEQSSLYDTNTIHMMSVVFISDIDHKNGWIMPLFFAMISVVFVYFQSALFYWLSHEALRGSCASHDDCSISQYCAFDADWFPRPTCQICEVLYDSGFDQECEYSLNEGLQNIDDAEQNIIWFDLHRYDYPLYNITQYGENYNCFAWKHCKNTEMYSETNSNTWCDHLVLIAIKFTWMQKLIFNFVIILFSIHMSSDIEEALVEEVVLMKGMAGPTSKNNFPTKLIAQLSLRHRRFVLPWMTAAGVIVITLSDSLSIQNILMNIVSIEFIMQADTIIAFIFRCNRQKVLPEKLLQTTVENGGALTRLDFWEVRLCGLLPGFAIVFSVMNFVVLILNMDCEAMNKMMWRVMVRYPWIVTAFHCLLLAFQKLWNLKLKHVDGKKESKEQECEGELLDDHAVNSGGTEIIGAVLDLFFEAAINLWAWSLNMFMCHFLEWSIWFVPRGDGWQDPLITWGVLTLSFSILSVSLFFRRQVLNKVMLHFSRSDVDQTRVSFWLSPNFRFKNVTERK